MIAQTMAELSHLVRLLGIEFNKDSQRSEQFSNGSLVRAGIIKALILGGPKSFSS
jgi:hypothetical protein